MKKLLLVFFVLASSAAFAQNYRLFVLEPQGGYQALPKPAAELRMPWGNIDDNYGYINAPGFSIKIFGTTYTLSDSSQLGVSTLGNLKIENDTSVVIIDGYFTGLDSVSPDSKILYRITGEPGLRVISIEYQKIGYAGCNDSSHVTFKMNLEEKTGNIIFDYGENVIVCDSALGDKQGPWVGIFRSNLTFTKFYKINWLSGNPNAPKIVSSSLPALGGIPMTNTSYLFAPPVSDVRSDEIHTSVPRISYSTDGITLHTEAGASRNAIIYDELGRAVDRISIASSNTQTRVPTEQLARGVYFVYIDNELRQMRW